MPGTKLVGEGRSEATSPQKVALIDYFAAHLAPTVRPLESTEQALDTLLSLTGCDAAAVFVEVHGDFQHYASRGEPQPFDDLVREVSQHHLVSLSDGEPQLVPDGGEALPAAVVAIPGDDDLPKALVCVRGADMQSRRGVRLDRLRRVAPALGRMLFARGNPILNTWAAEAEN